MSEKSQERSLGNIHTRHMSFTKYRATKIGGQKSARIGCFEARILPVFCFKRFHKMFFKSSLINKKSIKYQFVLADYDENGLLKNKKKEEAA